MLFPPFLETTVEDEDADWKEEKNSDEVVCEEDYRAWTEEETIHA